MLWRDKSFDFITMVTRKCVISRLPWPPHCDQVVLGSCGEVQQWTETSTAAGRLCFWSFFCQSCALWQLCFNFLCFSLWQALPVFHMKALQLFVEAMDLADSVWRSGVKFHHCPGDGTILKPKYSSVIWLRMKASAKNRFLFSCSIEFMSALILSPGLTLVSIG